MSEPIPQYDPDDDEHDDPDDPNPQPIGFRERMAKVMAERKAAGIVTKVCNPIERAQRNPTNKRLAIAAMCWDCQGRDADPHSRWRIGNCTSPDCPLYSHRPSQNLHNTPIPACPVQRVQGYPVGKLI
mgnify:CR=1 FL=1